MPKKQTNNLKSLFLYGKKVFNHETDKFDKWLYQENEYLSNRKPIDVLTLEGGIEEVADLLVKIEFCNFN